MSLSLIIFLEADAHTADLVSFSTFLSKVTHHILNTLMQLPVVDIWIIA